MMTRAKKAEEIANISEKFGRAKAAFLVDFSGMNVEQVTTLRKSLRPVDSEMRVVRNTLAKLALKDYPEMDEALSSSFKGVNAVVFSYEDPSASAKALTNFKKDVDALSIRTGALGGKQLSDNQITYLATLPSKPELQAKLLGTLQAPMAKLVRTMNEVPSSFARVLNTYKESKE